MMGFDQGFLQEMNLREGHCEAHRQQGESLKKFGPMSMAGMQADRPGQGTSWMGKTSIYPPVLGN